MNSAVVLMAYRTPDRPEEVEAYLSPWRPTTPRRTDSLDDDPQFAEFLATVAVEALG